MTKLPANMSQLDYLWTTYGSYQVINNLNDDGIPLSEAIRNYVKDNTLNKEVLDVEVKRLDSLIDALNTTIANVNNRLDTEILPLVKKNTDDIADIKAEFAMIEKIYDDLVEKTKEVSAKVDALDQRVTEQDTKIDANTKSILSEITRATNQEQAILKQIADLTINNDTEHQKIYKKIDDTKSELVGTASDTADSDSIKGAKLYTDKLATVIDTQIKSSSLAYNNAKITFTYNGQVISTIDCADFIKDRFMSGAEIVENPTGQAPGKYIKFTFNTTDQPQDLYLDVKALEIDTSSFVTKTELNTINVDLSKKIDDEIAARTAADTALDNKIDTVKADVTSNTSAIAKEVQDRTDADTALDNKITALGTDSDSKYLKVQGGGSIVTANATGEDTTLDGKSIKINELGSNKVTIDIDKIKIRKTTIDSNGVTITDKTDNDILTANGTTKTLGTDIPTLTSGKLDAAVIPDGVGGKVDDIQVNGASVVSNKVANIDLSSYVSLDSSKTAKDLLAADKTYAHIGTADDSTAYTAVAPIADGKIPAAYIPDGVGLPSYLTVTNRKMLFSPEYGKAIKLEDFTIGDENDFSFIKLKNLQINTLTRRGTVTLTDHELLLKTIDYNSTVEISKDRVFVQKDGKTVVQAKETGIKFGEDNGTELIPTANYGFYKANGVYDSADSVAGYLAPLTVSGTDLKLDNKYLNVSSDWATAKDTDLVTKAAVAGMPSSGGGGGGSISTDPVITTKLSVRAAEADSHGAVIDNSSISFTSQDDASVSLIKVSTDGIAIKDKTVKDLVTAQNGTIHIGADNDDKAYEAVAPLGSNGKIPSKYVESSNVFLQALGIFKTFSGSNPYADTLMMSYSGFYITEGGSNKIEFAPDGIKILSKSAKDVLTAWKSTVHIGASDDRTSYGSIVPLGTGDVIPARYIPTADDATLGGVYKKAFTDSSDTSTVTGVNSKLDALIAKLKECGVLA